MTRSTPTTSSFALGSHARKGGRRVDRGTLAALSAGSLLVAVVATAGATASVSGAVPLPAPKQARAAAAQSCDSTIVELPDLPGTEGSTADAMNDNGVLVGTALRADDQLPSRVVMWTAVEAPIDLGIGGVVRPDRKRVDAHAVDINEAGVVAAVRTVHTPRRRVVRERGALWNETDGVTTLPATRGRPWSTVTALNDDGVPVGYVWGRGRRGLPVTWVDDKLKRLKIPAKATSGYAWDINNDGLIVGWVFIDGELHPRWWQPGKGRGALSVEGLAEAELVAGVDDRGRIVGNSSRGLVKWRSTSAKPRLILKRLESGEELGGTRHVVGSTDGFRGFGGRAWVARYVDPEVARLPNPESGGAGWDNVFGTALARGKSALTPDGGLTVAGTAESFDEFTIRAVLWTCAQTRFD